ncbi:MAG: transcription-repair coupling factor [Eubacteriaceae bacterium]|nr:transcription-repair coupling factor [Eubacteriaceae bacterium]
MSRQGITNISGVSESRSAYVISQIAKEEGQSLIITATGNRAHRLASDLSFFTDKEVLVLPAEDQIFLRYAAKNHDQLIERLKILKALRTNADCIVVAPVSAAIKKISPHKNFEKLSLHLERGSEIDPEAVKETLVKMGYERMDIVNGKGEFSFRGGIIDIFTPDGDNPYRIELFDREIDDIRSFDIETQRSVEPLKFVEVFPAEQMLADKGMFEDASKLLHKEYTTQIKKLEKNPETLEAADNLTKRRNELCEYITNVSNLQMLENYLHYFYDETEYLWDYMEKGSVIIDDPERIYEFLDTRSAEIKDDFKVMLERGQIIPKDMELITGKDDLMKVYQRDSVFLLTPFPKTIKGVSQYSQIHNVNARQMISFNGRMDVLENELKSYVRENYRIVCVLSSDERIDNIKEFVERIGISGRVEFARGSLSAGMDFPGSKLCYISENDIFSAHKSLNRKRKSRKSSQAKLQSFSDMKAGDYVVHENHGIGRFIGIEQLTVQGDKKDYIKIKYAGNDMLYVPVEQMDMVQKYIGSDGITPKINKLSGGEWKLTKAKAKAAIAEMASELLDLYAKRKMKQGHAFGEDTVWQKEFEDSFPYEETSDQLRATAEIKEDMERPVAMDRLLCGDVGFGKTEVAARALFKCLTDGKQAAVLVPTTILANQHYYTLKERFEQFPFKVEMLSRFRSDKQQKKIIEQVKAGEIDLIIGTHRLLSDDIEYKDLGLLVIDEEQRFGVAHKEKIKQIKENVDVLTLSATPIPRTLNMSLTGIKDMSIIEEPPEERYPVQTYVLEQDDTTLKEVITREIDRGGQVYVVYNRVRGINKIAEKIRELVPEADVVVGHGQMNEHVLEDVMLSFINGEHNVLVATTIIESGIDISNANTMVIMDADRYGLSQLYQLRGRVGRSNRIAYAYLMYQKDKVLTEVAEKRLKAIKEFTEFGAGFKVAMRDLEIRGAGNLLGSQQSGHMMNIGYELYCKLVDDAIRALKGEIVKDRDQEEELAVEIRVTANIPNWYIENETLKLQMYKKIAAIRTEEEADELYDEMLDRFGDVPRETMNLVRISRIRSLAEDLSVVRISEQGDKIIVQFGEQNPLSGYALFNVNEAFGLRAFVHGGKEPFIRISTKPMNKLEDCIRLLEILSQDKKSS